jgi:hypothetical protein
MGRNEKMAAAVAAIGGGALLVFLATRKGGDGALAPLKPGETLDSLYTPTLDSSSSVIEVTIGQPFPVLNPQARYGGSPTGRDTYTHFRIVQNDITVYGSGVAGVHLGVPDGPVAPQQYYLVSPNEPQPAGCPAGQHLCCFPWPGLPPTPICGAAPRPGLATGIFEIYECSHPVGDPQHDRCFESPSCIARDASGRPARLPVARKTYPNRIRFK